ncbi:MAG: hypothetical protein WHS44_10535 [Fimbriimonadales bacterium]|nr:MAG: hypothetical protein KatS3mg018_2254 [Fimbriimonadales bacterium]
MILHECLNHWLRRYGESFRVGVQFYRGLFFQPPVGLLRWRFSTEQMDALSRPLWAIAVAPTVSLPDGTTLVWRGSDYRVLLSLEFRFDTTPVYRLMLVEPVV